MTLKPDQGFSTGTWPESLGDNANPTVQPEPKTNYRHLGYAVFLSSVFWAGILLISHLIW